MKQQIFSMDYFQKATVGVTGRVGDGKLGHCFVKFSGYKFISSR